MNVNTWQASRVLNRHAKYLHKWSCDLVINYMNYSKERVLCKCEIIMMMEEPLLTTLKENEIFCVYLAHKQILLLETIKQQIKYAYVLEMDSWIYATLAISPS